MFNKILIYRIFKNLPCPCRNVFQIFLNFYYDVKKWRFDIHFNVFCQKFSHSGNLLTLPSIWFYCYYRQSAREVPPVRSPQCTAAPVDIPISSSPGPHRVRGEAGSQLGLLSALFECNDVAALFWANFWNRSALLHKCLILGEVSLHLVKERSKLNGPW